MSNRTWRRGSWRDARPAREQGRSAEQRGEGMRSTKGSRRIVVGDVEYRWRARGDDGYIVVGIWPSNNIGAYLEGNLRYHETWSPMGAGWTSDGDQIVITARIVRRVIEHATTEHRYDPAVSGADINLRNLDDVIRWDDAVRAGERDFTDPKTGTTP